MMFKNDDIIAINIMNKTYILDGVVSVSECDIASRNYHSIHRFRIPESCIWKANADHFLTGLLFESSHSGYNGPVIFCENHNTEKETQNEETEFMITFPFHRVKNPYDEKENEMKQDSFIQRYIIPIISATKSSSSVGNSISQTLSYIPFWSLKKLKPKKLIDFSIQYNQFERLLNIILDLSFLIVPTTSLSDGNDLVELAKSQFGTFYFEFVSNHHIGASILHTFNENDEILETFIRLKNFPVLVTVNKCKNSMLSQPDLKIKCLGFLQVYSTNAKKPSISLSCDTISIPFQLITVNDDPIQTLIDFMSSKPQARAEFWKNFIKTPKMSNQRLDVVISHIVLDIFEHGTSVLILNLQLPSSFYVQLSKSLKLKNLTIEKTHFMIRGMLIASSSDIMGDFSGSTLPEGETELMDVSMKLNQNNVVIMFQQSRKITKYSIQYAYYRLFPSDPIRSLLGIPNLMKLKNLYEFRVIYDANVHGNENPQSLSKEVQHVMTVKSANAKYEYNSGLFTVTYSAKNLDFINCVTLKQKVFQCSKFTSPKEVRVELGGIQVAIHTNIHQLCQFLELFGIYFAFLPELKEMMLYRVQCILCIDVSLNRISLTVKCTTLEEKMMYVVFYFGSTIRISRAKWKDKPQVVFVHDKFQSKLYDSVADEAHAFTDSSIVL